MEGARRNHFGAGIWMVLGTRIIKAFDCDWFLGVSGYWRTAGQGNGLDTRQLRQVAFDLIKEGPRIDRWRQVHSRGQESARIEWQMQLCQSITKGKQDKRLRQDDD